MESTPRYANYIQFSDVDPYEVVRVISSKCIEVREMDATQDPSYKPEVIPGGFAGVVVNSGSQKWIITPNPKNRIERIRLHKDGRWYGAGKTRFALADQPRKYYDFNF